MLDTVKLRAARERVGMTQTEAAARAGMSLGRWNDIESGRRANVSIKTLDRLAVALGVHSRELLK